MYESLLMYKVLLTDSKHEFYFTIRGDSHHVVSPDAAFVRFTYQTFGKV